MSDAESKPAQPEVGSSRISFEQRIAQSDLPTNAVNLIRDIVKRTRLWKSEKSAVAMELISHFKDGLASGQPIEKLISDFGDPKITAKLMRRAKKRNRPIWWARFSAVCFKPSARFWWCMSAFRC